MKRSTESNLSRANTKMMTIARIALSSTFTALSDKEHLIFFKTHSTLEPALHVTISGLVALIANTVGKSAWFWSFNKIANYFLRITTTEDFSKALCKAKGNEASFGTFSQSTTPERKYTSFSWQLELDKDHELKLRLHMPPIPRRARVWHVLTDSDLRGLSMYWV